jgi:hypothetical protein
MRIERDEFSDHYLIEADEDLSGIIKGIIAGRFININFPTEYMDGIEGDYSDRFYSRHPLKLRGVYFELRNSIDGRIVWRILKKNGII